MIQIYCFSLVFIKKMINNNKKQDQQCYDLYCIIQGPSQLFITCTHQRILGVHLYPIYVLYSIYIYIYI